jgi:hypothetical protein
MGAKENLKAFVRLDAHSRVVPSSLVLRKSKPKNGRWMEITTDYCCGPTTTTTTTTTTVV